MTTHRGGEVPASGGQEGCMADPVTPSPSTLVKSSGYAEVDEGFSGRGKGCWLLPRAEPAHRGVGRGAFGLKKSPGWDTHGVGLPSNEPATGPKVSATPSIHGRIGGGRNDMSYMHVTDLMTPSRIIGEAARISARRALHNVGQKHFYLEYIFGCELDFSPVIGHMLTSITNRYNPDSSRRCVYKKIVITIIYDLKL